VFCISLPDDARRPLFEKQAQAVGQKFQWWNAVDGRGETREDLEALTPWLVHWGEFGSHDTLQRPGELALILSSIALWEHAYEHAFDYLVVMEDDAKLLAPLVIEVPSDADLVFFNDRSRRDANGLTSGYVCGTDGYYASRSGIAKLLQLFKQIYMPLDLQMIAQMPQMKDCGHHLAERFNDNVPSLISYTVKPLVSHGNSVSIIR
jgi:GR25 family glycosyltransferase involved in LPS biosynthesis